MGGLLAFRVGNYDNTAEREQFRFLCGQLKAHYENLEDFCVFVGNYNIEGEAPHYSISLSIAKNTNQLPSYTKTKGLDKERLRQMVLQYLSNAGEEGAKRDSIYEYLKDVLPANKTEKQQLRYVGRLLVELNEEKQIDRIGLKWILKDYKRSV